MSGHRASDEFFALTGVATDRAVWTPAIEQVDNRTPILPSREKSSIYGTRGTAGRYGFIKR